MFMGAAVGCGTKYTIEKLHADELAETRTDLPQAKQNHAIIEEKEKETISLEDHDSSTRWGAFLGAQAFFLTLLVASATRRGDQFFENAADKFHKDKPVKKVTDKLTV